MNKIPLALDRLVPQAQYGGYAADQKSYDALIWVDARDKPDWAVLEAELVSVERAAKIAAVKREAERRIGAGTLIGNSPFRCDDRSMVRVLGMVRAAEKAEAVSNPVGITFRTDAGVQHTITSAAAANAVYDACQAHIADILATSSELQGAALVMTAEEIAAFDPSDNTHWS